METSILARDKNGKPSSSISQTSAQKKHVGEIQLGYWNSWGLSRERMDYLFGSEDGSIEGQYPPTGKGEWVVGLGECRRKEQEIAAAWGSERMIVGERAPDGDKAAGAALVMSPGMLRCLEDSGFKGSRIVWAQYSTKADIPFFVIFVYIPHFGRVSPSADDTFAELRELMAELRAKKHGLKAMFTVMGDFNARLARAYDYTGRKRVLKDSDDVESEVTGPWSVHHQDNEMGKKLREFLVDFDLAAANTYFKPKRKKAGAGTYEPFEVEGVYRKGATLDYGCV